MSGERIFIVTDQGPTTGIGVYAEMLTRLLRESSLNPTLLSLCYLPGEEHLGWERLPGSRVARGWYDIPSVMRHNDRELRAQVPPDSAVHFCGVSYSSVANYPRSIVTVHDHYPRTPSLVNIGRPRVLLRDLASLRQFIESPRQIRTARRRVVPTQHVQQCLSRRTSLSSTVIHHWVDTTRFHPRDKWSARSRLGLPAEGKLVLSVSTGSSNKNYGLLARVSSRLGRGYQLVLGGGREAPRGLLGIRLPRLSEEAYPLLFNACDVYFHASTQEGFGWPLVESMASGLPIVALNTEVAQEVLGDAALYVQPTDPASRAVDMIVKVSCEPLRSEMVSRLVRRCSAFSPDLARQTYLLVYREAFGL